MNFKKTRKKAIKIIDKMKKKEINTADIHDAVWLIWYDYYQERGVDK
ncbi:MAG: hypothetical protein ACE5KT_03280 [Methanosarcinales archaeon]